MKDWEEEVVVPIIKKRDDIRVEEYRGITLAPTLYKVYASMFVERLKEEMERKDLVPQNQTGFRKGIGTINNIFTLNYMINKQISIGSTN